MEQSSIHQLIEWIKGNSIHNDERDECCPDFSCCNSELAWELELRKEFFEADDEKRNSMLMMALGAAIEATGKRDKVYIAGLDSQEDN